MSPDDDKPPVTPRTVSAPTVAREQVADASGIGGTGDTYDPAADSLPGVRSSGRTDGGLPVILETPGRYDYEHGEELGRGGIGRVLLVHDGHLGRDVAVKELLSGGVAAGRFLREARVTAQLEHPNIVPVYELGRRLDGTLYYTMKRVRGRTLASALEECNGMEGRLALLGHFVSTCQAVAYAHSRGVVHRDIKPSNIMVGEFGETVLLDWGLAKVRGQRDLRGGDIERELLQLKGGDSQVTLQGATLGTPAYMSPEQAEGRIDDIDTRSDVWSLGAVLFEILTGVAPFAGRTPLETLQKVIHEPSPSADEAPIDLANVCSKALERDPALRYPSAAELAEEIVQWQAGRTVRAHRYTPLQVAAKFLARNRSMVVALLVVGIGLSGIAAVWSNRLSGAKEEAQDQATVASSELAAALSTLAASALDGGDPAGALVYAASALERAEGPESRGILMAASSGWIPEREWQTSLGEPVQSVSVSADGSRVAFAGRGGTYLRTDGAERIRKVEVSGDASPGAGFVNDANLVTPGSEGSIVVWADRTVVRRLKTARPVRAMMTDGARSILVGTENGVVERWDSRTGMRRGRYDALGAVVSVGGSLNESVVAAAVRIGPSRVWLAGSESPFLLPSATSLAVSPDGRQVALSLRDPAGSVDVWALSPISRRTRLGGSVGGVRSLVFSPDGRYLAGCDDRGVRIWELQRGLPIGVLRIGGEAVSAVAFSPTGDSVVAVTRSGEAAKWRGTPPTSPDRGGVDSTPSPGLSVATAGTVVEFVDAIGTVVLTSEALPAAASDAANLGSAAAVSLVDGRVVALDGAHVLGASNATGMPVGKPVFAPDAQNVYAADGNGTVWGWAFGSMALSARLTGLPPGEVSIAVSADSRWVFAGGADGKVAAWDARSGKLHAIFRADDSAIQRLEFLGSSELWTTSAVGQQRVWDTTSLGWPASQAQSEAQRRTNLRLVGGVIAGLP